LDDAALPTADEAAPAVSDIFHTGRRAYGGRAVTLVAAAMVVVAMLVAATGCGGSSKPAYCSDRDSLNSSIKGLSGAASGGVSGLKSQLATIQSDAKALAGSAKSDFPSQTSAITSSVNTLSSAVKALPANPSTAQIASLAADAAAVVSSVKAFSDATSSKCG
jgi:hypothetical protein